MKRFKNILFVFEDTIQPSVAFQRAVRVAKRNSAKLTVILSVDDLPLDPEGQDPLIADTWWSLRETWKATLDELAAGAREDGVDAASLVIGGPDFIEIVRTVLRLDADLLIKEAKPYSGHRALAFQSTDMHLMRKCPCPVWLHKDEAEGPYRKILAAVDVTRHDPGVNRLIMDLATSLAAREEADLDIVHVWSLAGEASLRGRAFLKASSDQIERLLQQEREKHVRALENLTQGYATEHAFEEHLLKGDARTVIPEFAARERSDLIIMGTVGRTGLPGLLMGNTAEDILRQVDCSVLTVKPEGFASPVTLDP